MLRILAATQATPDGGSKDDDFFDRLSNRYTVGIIITFAAVASFRQWVGGVINCWAPKHFTSSHTKYATNYCWVRNTYYLPFNDEIPRQEEDRDYIVYYQWIPFLLLTQAFLFFAPSLFWHGLNQKSGVDSDTILQLSNSVSSSKDPCDEPQLKILVFQIDRFLRAPKVTQQDWQSRFKKFLNILCCQCCRPKMGNYLTILYLMSKLLYIANSIGQLYILNGILKTDYEIFGITFFKNYWNDAEYRDNSPIFPRVTLCDFDVRRLGNVQRYTVQCVLPFNHFLEKMYVFLWFWMVFVAAMSCFGFIIWLLRALFRSDRLKFIRNHLKQKGLLSPASYNDNSEEFLNTYLRQDGAFLLRLIAHNTNHTCTTEVIAALYEYWMTLDNTPHTTYTKI